MGFLKGLARMFTIPKATRAKLNANPLAPVVKVALANELGTAINMAVGKAGVSGPAADAITEALNHVVSATGILD